MGAWWSELSAAGLPSIHACTELAACAAVARAHKRGVHIAVEPEVIYIVYIPCETCRPTFFFFFLIFQTLVKSNREDAQAAAVAVARRPNTSFTCRQRRIAWLVGAVWRHYVLLRTQTLPDSLFPCFGIGLHATATRPYRPSVQSIGHTRCLRGLA